MKWVIGVVAVGLYCWLIFYIDTLARRDRQKLLDKIRCTKRVFHRVDDDTFAQDLAHVLDRKAEDR